MVKLIGPMHSDGAKGTIGKTITYGTSAGISWARAWFIKKYTITPEQAIIRELFALLQLAFGKMSMEEKWLWDLATRNYKDYGSELGKYLSRTPRCQYAHDVLSARKFIWEGSPFPPSLYQMMMKDEIPGYDQIVSDVETLTGLSFCTPVNPYLFRYLGTMKSKQHPGYGGVVAGLCAFAGQAIAIDETSWMYKNAYKRKLIIAHELTHAIMEHHGWAYYNQVLDSENIAGECGVRVADGDLTPVYTYQGKTLSEWVDDVSCAVYEKYKNWGWFE